MKHLLNCAVLLVSLSSCSERLRESDPTVRDSARSEGFGDTSTVAVEEQEFIGTTRLMLKSNGKDELVVYAKASPNPQVTAMNISLMVGAVAAPTWVGDELRISYHGNVDGLQFALENPGVVITEDSRCVPLSPTSVEVGQTWTSPDPEFDTAPPSTDPILPTPTDCEQRYELNRNLIKSADFVIQESGQFVGSLEVIAVSDLDLATRTVDSSKFKTVQVTGSLSLSCLAIDDRGVQRSLPRAEWPSLFPRCAELFSRFTDN